MILAIHIDVDVDESSISDRVDLQRFADQMAAHGAAKLVEDYANEDEHGGRVDGYQGRFVRAANPRPVELP